MSRPLPKMDRILEGVAGTPWLILPEKLDEICAFLSLRAAGELPESIQQRFAEAIDRQADAQDATLEVYAEAGVEIVDGVALVPLTGTLMPRANLMSRFSGGTSTQIFAAAVEQAVADPAVRAVVLRCDSGGGTALGCFEAAERVFALRGRKPIVAVCDSGVMASACYAIASAAEEVYASEGSLVGSIGTLLVHLETSRADEKAGRTFTVFREGQRKADGNPHEPLSDEARDSIQTRIRATNELFLAAVARHRGVTAEVVRDGFGQGRVFLAAEAARRGLIDGVATLEAILARYTAANGAGGSTAHHTEPEVLTMDRLIAALQAKNLLSENAPAAEAEAAMTVFAAARGCDLPEGEDARLALLASEPPVAPAAGSVVLGSQAELDLKLTEAREAGYAAGKADAAKLSHQEAVAAGVAKTRAEIVDILARCETVGTNLSTALSFVRENLSLDVVRDRLLTDLVARNRTVGAGDDTTLGAKKDPDAKFKQEFADAGGELKLGCTEAQYVASRRIDEGLDTLDSMRRRQAAAE